MKKFYINNINQLNEEEKKTGCISYRRLIHAYVENIILCNNVAEDVDFMMSAYDAIAVYDEDEDEYTYPEIYQWYITDCNEYEKEALEEYDIQLVYNEAMDLYILPVTHYGTRWDYVITSVEWSTNWDECKK